MTMVIEAMGQGIPADLRAALGDLVKPAMIAVRVGPNSSATTTGRGLRRRRPGQRGKDGGSSRGRRDASGGRRLTFI